MKDFTFTDAMRQKYGKMSYPELQACLMPNELTYVCKEILPIFTYIANEDCEATLIHPSTISLPDKLCELSRPSMCTALKFFIQPVATR